MGSAIIVCTASLMLMVCQGAASEKTETPDADTLYAGWAMIDITPEKPVALIGQLTKRISQKVRDPLTATALALETKTPNGRREQALLISCDVLCIWKAVQERVRSAVKAELPDLDVEKLFLNATHTHTAPGFGDTDFGALYDVSEDEGVMKASEYADFFVERIAKAAASAWRSRKPSGMSWALGHAVIGMNRRTHYRDGSTVMYGSTNRPDFQNVEGYEDHGVELLFFWDENKTLVGIIINIACTAQETEGLSEISADFWHDVRAEARKRLSRDIFILPQCAAAGDASPHLLYRSRAEDIMRQRRGLSNRQEIARRIVDAVESALPLARQDMQTRMVFRHKVARVSLPPQEPPVPPFYVTDTVDPVEFHVIRLGDVALATNPFELYLDYGVRLKARSLAIMTLLVQLSCQNGGYLPTERAIRGGGYSADKFIVGPEGGQALVDETVKQLNALWN